jgi:hypothetical protein
MSPSLLTLLETAKLRGVYPPTTTGPARAGATGREVMRKIKLKNALLGLGLAAAALAALIAAPSVQAESDLDFTVANATGYGIKALYVGPSTSKEWDDNLLTEVLENGETVDITFSPKAEKIKKWDLRVDWVDDDEAVEWHGFDLASISKITLKYDRESGKSTAVTE